MSDGPEPSAPAPTGHHWRKGPNDSGPSALFATLGSGLQCPRPSGLRGAPTWTGGLGPADRLQARRTNFLALPTASPSERLASDRRGASEILAESRLTLRAREVGPGWPGTPRENRGPHRSRN